MTVRVGVDVGGTFTKAIAFDLAEGRIVAEALVATTHQHADGAAAGVVEVVGRIAQAVGPDRIELVTHSTTQAVNALLEGDVATVGMIGMGRAPDLRKARRRTVDVKIELGEDQPMETVSAFLDVTGGLDAETASTTARELRDAGAEALAVAEAFAPDDLTNERIVRDAASALGLPVTTSAELTGLYGLEMRAVTAALNASILPIAQRTAEVVAAGVTAAGIEGPVMVMRGDGGATDLAGFMNAPTRTLYSGPAASVAGALRSGGIENAVIVEVGGTSTNVAAIRRGRPMLSYVQVASHATAIRALDVRVLGVAGGSMLRARRDRVYGVGPRSAHIAALPYACFLPSAALTDARAVVAAPRVGDPADYVVLHLADGGRAALTNTCAANALGLVGDGDYAEGDRDAARAGFAAAGAMLGLDGDEVARRMLQASTQAVGDLVATVIHEHRLERPLIVAVGGGAGGLGRAVASAMGLEISVPAHAEVISALGDALSLIRAERERTYARPTPADTQQLIGEVETEAIAAGASASSLDVRVEHITDRSAVRVTVSGAVGLLAGALPGRRPATREEAEMAARERGCPGARAVGQFWVADDAEGGRVVVFDRYADVIVDVRGETVDPGAELSEGALREALDRQTRHRGPIEIVPDAWVLSGSRFLQVPAPDVASIMETASAIGTHRESTTVVVGRD